MRFSNAILVVVKNTGNKFAIANFSIYSLSPVILQRSPKFFIHGAVIPCLRFVMSKRLASNSQVPTVSDINQLLQLHLSQGTVVASSATDKFISNFR